MASLNKQKSNYNKDALRKLVMSPDSLKVFYFLGRLNPPHKGHIQALVDMITLAHAHSPIPPLIILGSGPKQERTLNNPIPYDLKEEFIRTMLESKLPAGTRFEIRQLKSTWQEETLNWFKENQAEPYPELVPYTDPELATPKDE